MQNESWAYALIDGLIQQGVDYFCCAPGSRSTPLALAVANHPNAKATVHFDERGVGFHALGYAKAKGKAAVIIVTSGTAVANLLPAVMEADLERIPMILLTADRPPELRDCGANQTCDQVKLFNTLVRWQIDMPCPEKGLSAQFLTSTLSQALLMSRYPTSGPVHINCMFREPLFSKITEESALQTPTHIFTPHLCPSEAAIERAAALLSQGKKGILLAGSTTEEETTSILALAEKLQWPIFADILSPLRCTDPNPALITHFDLILKSLPELDAEAIVQFGDRFVSKTLLDWIGRQPLDFYLHVTNHHRRQDPLHAVTDRILTSSAPFIQELMDKPLTPADLSWRAQWEQLDLCCHQALNHLPLESGSITEMGLIYSLSKRLSHEWTLFFSNSMPIRDANQLFPIHNRSGRLFGNRGVSGIDGNIATASGIAVGCQKPTLLLIGDLAFLHDVNSLAYLLKTKIPVVICVVNNGGGGIFSFLPIAQKAEKFEEFFAASHSFNLTSAAALFNIPYFSLETFEELEAFLHQQNATPSCCILEIKTDRKENHLLHQSIYEHVLLCLKTLSSPVETPATLT